MIRKEIKKRAALLCCALLMTGAPMIQGMPGQLRAEAAQGASYENGQEIGLNSEWKYADFAAIKSGKAVFYRAEKNRKGKIIAVNAGHGTKGGTSVKTWCHPDKTPKVTGGTTSAGAKKAVAVSSGMTFKDGTPESKVTLRMAQLLKDKLMEAVDIQQLESFDAGTLFAKAEGIIPAPESCHAIAAAIREANACKESGEEKVILFNLSGHGLIDMSAYDQYLAGNLTNSELTDTDIQHNLVPGLIDARVGKVAAKVGLGRRHCGHSHRYAGPPA